MSYLCSEPPADIRGQLVDDGKGNYKGECVSLVKRLCALMPATSSWKRGKRVKDVPTLASLTAIATFNDAGKFAGHAAIYVSQDKDGLLVWDQYNHPEKGVGTRRLPFDDKKTDVNNGNKFYVID